jgi:hypothetical protein
MTAEQWERVIGGGSVALALGVIGISSATAILLGLSMHSADRASVQDYQPLTRAARRQAQQQQAKAAKQKGSNS